MRDPWFPDAERVETAAQGGYGVPRGEMRATAIVVHVIEGWLSTMIRWAHERPMRTKVSYHFVIGRDGHIIQFVPIDNPAWHAGRRDDVDPTWPLWEPARNPGGHTVAIARAGFSRDPWRPEQVDAAVNVTRWTMEQHEITPSAETLIGHYELNPLTRARDPGGDWDKGAMLVAIAPAPGAVEALTALSIAAARAATALERREP